MSLEEEFSKAIWRCHELRAQHNGIMSIEIFLGHDGHNAVTFRDYDKVIGKGAKGGGILQAVTDAESDWRYRNLTSTEHGRKTLEGAFELACQKFGSDGGLFNTACFQTAINTHAYALLNLSDCLEILLSSPRVVRLKGGAHWLLLPEAHTRYQEED